MMKRLLWNEIRNHKLLSASTVMFMAVSSLLIALSAILFTDLLGSVNALMKSARTPDYLQMHAGDIDPERVGSFADGYPGVTYWQICPFLNLENSSLVLGDRPLADNTQDNGLCVQGENFDYLLDMDGELPAVKAGQVYVPACYRSLYDLRVGDKMGIGTETLTIAGFIRDSQMNSMMASSKRFLVCRADYERMRDLGEEEYLIEFLLKEDASTDSLDVEYKKAGLYANGPTITKPLIGLMNALSDGIMIFVILLVGIAVLLISLLCIGFITALGAERDRKEAGMLKALGIGNRQIRRLYISKYILFSAAGSLVGLLGAWMLKNPLSEKLRELYGAPDSGVYRVVLAIAACVLVQGLILLCVGRILKRAEKMSVMEALFSAQTPGRKTEIGQYAIIGLVAAACTVLTLIPQNLHSTLSSPEFVTYMGIGDAHIRMDLRQSENIGELEQKLTDAFSADPEVVQYTVLKTVSCPANTGRGDTVNLLVEIGDHLVFPVTYAQGKQPEAPGEIALSSLQAQDLGLEVGDTLELFCDGQSGSAVVCGIYSDITNGGKTAKMTVLPGNARDNTDVMWSILYVSLRDDALKTQWIETYRQYGVDIVDIADYVRGTYGPTIDQVARAKGVAMGIAVLILYVVVMLFMRLMIERKRYSISLQKAIGFRNGQIRKAYFTRGCLPVSVGILAGVLLAVALGEGICGQALKAFGAEGFHFVIRWEQVLWRGCILLVTVVAALIAGTCEVKEIKAYECCMRKD